MMKYFKHPIHKDGFTLLEFLIALFIFAIGILSMASLQIASIRGNYFSNSITEATTLSQDRVEEFMNTAYSNSTMTDSDSDGSSGLDDNTVATADHNVTRGRYTILWNVADGLPTTNCKTIRIITIWTERGLKKQVTVTYIKSSSVDNSY